MAQSPPLFNLDQKFLMFGKAGDKNADGKTMTLAQVQGWFKQSGVLDAMVTDKEVEGSFLTFKKKAITYQDFVTLVQDIARKKRIPVEEIQRKLIECGVPLIDEAALDEKFLMFGKAGDKNADGKTMTLAQVQGWFKQSGILDAKVTDKDVEASFLTFKKKAITYQDFINLINDIAKKKKIPVEDITKKLIECGTPLIDEAAQAVTQVAGQVLTGAANFLSK